MACLALIGIFGTAVVLAYVPDMVVAVMPWPGPGYGTGRE